MSSSCEPADAASAKEMERFTTVKMTGKGTFGTVHLAREKSTGQQVAIKRVIQDPRFRNRELNIMKDLSKLRHPNLVKLVSNYFTVGEKSLTVSLNVVMEFIPETLYRCYRTYYRSNTPLPQILLKVFTFQLIRSIACLHLNCVNVCHRDIKPHNVLVDEPNGTLKLCDFGSAKNLSASEPSVAYICSRFYRAPELIFGNQYYTTAVDIWSVGCIFAEMMLGQPIFRGEDSQEQLNAIVKILGSIPRDELRSLQKNSSVKIQAPADIKPMQWPEVIRNPQPKEAFDLLSSLLRYLPEDRILPFDALCHPYFDELRKPGVQLPSGNPLPSSLFRFIPEEIAEMSPAQRAKLVKK